MKPSGLKGYLILAVFSSVSFLNARCCTCLSYWSIVWTQRYSLDEGMKCLRHQPRKYKKKKKKNCVLEVVKRTWLPVDHRAEPGQSQASSSIPHLWNVCFAHRSHVRSQVQECSLERRMCCWDYLDWICDWTWKVEDRNFYHFLLDSQVYLLSYRAVLSDSVATNCLWLFEFKITKN